MNSAPYLHGVLAHAKGMPLVYVSIDVHKDQSTVWLFTREEERLLIEPGKIPARTDIVKTLRKAEKEVPHGKLKDER